MLTLLSVAIMDHPPITVQEMVAAVTETISLRLLAVPGGAVIAIAIERDEVVAEEEEE